MIRILEILPAIYFWLYVLLALSLVAHGVLLASARAAARPFRVVPWGLFAAAIGVHVLHFFWRWSINEHAPIQSKHEVFAATALTTTIFSLLLYLGQKPWKLKGASAMAGSLVFGLLVGGSILWTALARAQDPKINNLVPALQSYWFAPHVSSYMLGYGSLLVAAVLALLYVVVECFCRLRGTRWSAGPLVERWTYKVTGMGFPFMTAALCMGSLWADDSWGEYWFWDAKETWALISWAFFVIYLHLRYVAGWAGLKGQLVVVGGGIMIWITYLWIHVLPASQASLHVYN